MNAPVETVVNGIRYPREIEPPEGTPPGWTCIEQVYHEGSCKGKAYRRFQSPDGKKGILSVKAAIKMDADSKGLDGDRIAAEFVAERKRKQREKEQLRESMNGQAMQRFVEAFGHIDGSTLQNWPGWSAIVKLIPSGQLMCTYVAPDNSRHSIMKTAQTLLGHRMLEGEDLANEHKEAVAKAASGGGNQARAALKNQLQAEGISTKDKGLKLTLSEAGGLTPFASAVVKESQAPRGRFAKRFATASRKTERKRELPQDPSRRVVRRLAAAEDHRGGASLAGVRRRVSAATGVQLSPAIAEEVAKLRALLVPRGFGDGGGLLAVVRGPRDELRGAERVCGIYYRLAACHNGRPCFKRDPASAGLMRRELYISWSTARSRWKIGALDDGKAGLAAFLAADLAIPTETPSVACIVGLDESDGVCAYVLLAKITC